MEVTGFRAAPTDLDARVNYPIKDWNGETCALIKVQTTLKGLSFETGTITPTKVEQRLGEYWVYVSPKIHKFNIYHADLLPLRYELPQTIESASVYYLTLRVNGPQTSGMFVQTVTMNSGYFKLKTTPARSIVRIGKTKDYELETVMVMDGSYVNMLDYGEYYYMVESDYYETYYGHVNFSETSTRLDINLRPAYNYLKLSSSPHLGARVVLKGLDTPDGAEGVTPFELQRPLHKGRYKVMLMYPEYAYTEQEIVLDGDGSMKEFTFEMKPQFGTVTCRCLNDKAEIWIDDEFKGIGTWTGHVSDVTSHKLEARLANHHSQSIAFTVKAGESTTVPISAPVPKMALLNVNSTPSFAKVEVDGEPFGESPLLKPLLMGKHTVIVSAEGHEPAKYEIDIAENQTYNLSVKLVSLYPEEPAAEQLPTHTPAVVEPEKPASPEPPAKTGRHLRFEQSVELSSGLLSGSDQGNGHSARIIPASIDYLAGLRAGHLFAGVGVSANYLRSDVSLACSPSVSPSLETRAEDLTVDVYANLKLYFLKHDKKVNPFLSASVGYNIDRTDSFTVKRPTDLLAGEYNDSGLCMSASFGLNFKLAKNCGLYLGGGYHGQMIGHIRSELANEKGTYYRRDLSDEILLNGFSFKLGITF